MKKIVFIIAIFSFLCFLVLIYPIKADSNFFIRAEFARVFEKNRELIDDDFYSSIIDSGTFYCKDDVLKENDLTLKYESNDTKESVLITSSGILEIHKNNNKLPFYAGIINFNGDRFLFNKNIESTLNLYDGIKCGYLIAKYSDGTDIIKIVPDQKEGSYTEYIPTHKKISTLQQIYICIIYKETLEISDIEDIKFLIQ